MSLKKHDIVQPILIVDDEPDVRDCLVETLRLAGFTACGVESAEEAVQKAQATFFPLIITDWQLKEASGLDACREIRQLPGYDSSVVLLITAYEHEAVLQQGVEAGIDDFLQKPLSLDLLLVRLTLASSLHREKLEKHKAHSYLEKKIEQRTISLKRRIAEIKCLQDLSVLFNRVELGLDVMLQHGKVIRLSIG